LRASTLAAREEVAGFIAEASAMSEGPGAASGLLLAASAIVDLSEAAKSLKLNFGKLWTMAGGHAQAHCMPFVLSGGGLA